MALTDCKECDHEISKKAETCPHCGAPQKRKTNLFTWVIVIVLSFWLFAVLTDNDSTTRTASITAPAIKIDTSPKMQAERKKFMQKLQKMNVIYKIDVPGDLPHVYVSSGFYSLKIDDKKSFMSVVYAYYLAQNPKATIVALYDSRSGKQIGTFTHRGLELD